MTLIKYKTEHGIKIGFIYHYGHVCEVIKGIKNGKLEKDYLEWEQKKEVIKRDNINIRKVAMNWNTRK